MVNLKENYHFSRFQRGANIFQGGSNFFQGGPIAYSLYTLVNVYVDLLVFTRIAGTS